MKFWKKKKKKKESKSENDSKSEIKVTKLTDDEAAEAQLDSEDGITTSPAPQDVKAVAVTDEPQELIDPEAVEEEETKEEAVDEAKTDDSADTKESDVTEETKPVDFGEEEEEEEEEEEVEVEDGIGDAYDEYAESGVFVFGSKIEGKLKKVFFSICAITVLPPAFLFALGLLLCVFLLLFPLIGVIIMVLFPATVFSLFILMALLPVLFPAVLIFLFITGKGKMSAFAEGKLLVLKLYKWTLPTI